LTGRRTREDEGNRGVIYFGEPIHSGYVLIEGATLANVTRLEHERWKRGMRDIPSALEGAARFGAGRGAQYARREVV